MVKATSIGTPELLALPRKSLRGTASATAGPAGFGDMLARMAGSRTPLSTARMADGETAGPKQKPDAERRPRNEFDRTGEPADQQDRGAAILDGAAVKVDEHWAGLAEMRLAPDRPCDSKGPEEPALRARENPEPNRASLTLEPAPPPDGGPTGRGGPRDAPPSPTSRVNSPFDDLTHALKAVPQGESNAAPAAGLSFSAGSRPENGAVLAAEAGIPASPSRRLAAWRDAGSLPDLPAPAGIQPQEADDDPLLRDSSTVRPQPAVPRLANKVRNPAAPGGQPAAAPVPAVVERRETFPPPANLPVGQQLADALASDLGQRDSAGSAALFGARPSRAEGRPHEAIKTLQIALHPADLGAIVVRMHLVGETLRVHVQAEKLETAELLERDGERMTRALASAGIKLEGMTVQVDVAAAAGRPDSSQSAQGQPAGPQTPFGENGGRQRAFADPQAEARPGAETQGRTSKDDHVDQVSGSAHPVGDRYV